MRAPLERAQRAKCIATGLQCGRIIREMVLPALHQGSQFLERIPRVVYMNCRIG